MKKLLSILLVGMLSVGITACGNSKDTAKKDDTSTPAPTETKKEEPKKEEKKNTTYDFGTEGVSGNWSIKVLEAKETNEIIIGGDEKKTTSEKFVVVKVQMTNKSNKAINWGPEEFKLIDTKNQTQYDPHFDTTQGINSKETIFNKNDKVLGIYDNLNPNLSKESYISFEVPKNVVLSDCILGNANDGSKEAVGYKLK